MLGRFLIVDPDRGAADLVAGACREFRAADVVHEIADARAVLVSPRRLVAMITEMDFPAGVGLDLIRAARKARPLLPILVLTGRAEPELINRAHSLRAEYHCKPTHRSSLRGFLRRAVAFERVEDVRISWAIDEMSRRNRLTAREVDLLVAAVAGVPRKTLADELGISENTLKTQIRGVLRKCSVGTLEELARATLQIAIADSVPRRPSTIPEPEGPPSIRASGVRAAIVPTEQELEEFRKQNNH